MLILNRKGIFRSVFSTLLLAIAVSVPANAALQTPSSVRFKIYEFWVSTSPLCTNPVRIYEAATPTYVELVGNPTLGSGGIAAGTYPCLMMVFSDQIKYTPTSTSGTCTAGVEETKDICRAGDIGKNVDGSTVTCGTSVDDRVTAFITTASNCTRASCTGNSLSPPTASTNDPDGAQLENAIVIGGSGATGTFVFNVTDGLDDTTANCSLENISFEYR